MGVDEFHMVSKHGRIKEVNKVSNLLCFDYKIGKNTVNNYKKEEIINEITLIINETKPYEIFIPNPSYNQDHQETYHACLVALRPHDRNHLVNNVFIYEVDQYLLWGLNNFNPVYFEKINIDIKIKAYKLHNSQVRDMRPPELLEKVSFQRGLSSGFDYAEGFGLLRMVGPAPLH